MVSRKQTPEMSMVAAERRHRERKVGEDGCGGGGIIT